MTLSHNKGDNTDIACDTAIAFLVDEDTKPKPISTKIINPYKRRVWYEGRKMIIHGKAPLQKSGTEFYKKLKKKSYENTREKNDKKVAREIKLGRQCTISALFSKR
jgi:hypothetical protein